MTTDEIIQAFQKVKTEDPKTYYNAMGAGDDGINIMHPFIGDAYALGLVAGAKYALEHFTSLQQEQPDNIDKVCQSIGAKLSLDGNAWCILLGDNLQEGTCGFGDTPADALGSFIKELTQKPKKP